MAIDWGNLDTLDYEVMALWHTGKRPIYVSERMRPKHYARNWGELLECYVLWDKPKGRYEMTEEKPVIDKGVILDRPNIYWL